MFGPVHPATPLRRDGEPLRLRTDPPRCWADVVHPALASLPIAPHPNSPVSAATDLAALTDITWTHPALPPYWWHAWICWQRIQSDINAGLGVDHERVPLSSN